MQLARTDRPLAELETVIERGLGTFVEVGLALLEIREARLYREQGYERFEDYCQQRWSFTYRRSHQLIEAASVVASLGMNNCSDLPANEAQARELTRLKNPEAQAEVWQEVEAESGIEHVTAQRVREAVDRRLGITPSVPNEEPKPADHKMTYQGKEYGWDPPDPERTTVGDLLEDGWIPPPPARLTDEQRAYFAIGKLSAFRHLDPSVVAETAEASGLDITVSEQRKLAVWIERVTDAIERRMARPSLHVVRERAES
jgi:hypothetical protein